MNRKFLLRLILEMVEKFANGKPRAHEIFGSLFSYKKKGGGHIRLIGRVNFKILNLEIDSCHITGNNFFK